VIEHLPGKCKVFSSNSRTEGKKGGVPSLHSIWLQVKPKNGQPGCSLNHMCLCSLLAPRWWEGWWLACAHKLAPARSSGKHWSLLFHLDLLGLEWSCTQQDRMFENLKSEQSEVLLYFGFCFTQQGHSVVVQSFSHCCHLYWCLLSLEDWDLPMLWFWVRLRCDCSKERIGEVTWYFLQCRKIQLLVIDTSGPWLVGELQMVLKQGVWHRPGLEPGPAQHSWFPITMFSRASQLLEGVQDVLVHRPSL
jgi:hypothetical protein